jgi:hypothetical protein
MKSSTVIAIAVIAVVASLSMVNATVVLNPPNLQLPPVPAVDYILESLDANSFAGTRLTKEEKKASLLKLRAKLHEEERDRRIILRSRIRQVIQLNNIYYRDKQGGIKHRVKARGSYVLKRKAIHNKYAAIDREARIKYKLADKKIQGYIRA